MNWLMKLIEECIKNRFTGFIQINFFGGGVTNVNKQESFKPPKE